MAMSTRRSLKGHCHSVTTLRAEIKGDTERISVGVLNKNSGIGVCRSNAWPNKTERSNFAASWRVGVFPAP